MSVLLPSSTLPAEAKPQGLHSEIPSFLRRSIEASDVWSSMRVAPRSVSRVTRLAMIARSSAATIRPGSAADVADGAKAHRELLDRLASRGGVSAVTARAGRAAHDARRCAK
jgi:hypothetical protein